MFVFVGSILRVVSCRVFLAANDHHYVQYTSKGGMGLLERKGTSVKSTKEEIGLQKFNPSKWGKNVFCFLK